MLQTIRQVGIFGSGKYLPEKILSNLELAKMVDTSDEWIVSRTGIRERRIAPEGVTCCDLAVEAGRLALADAGVKPEEVDLVLLGTITPDTILPAASCLVQQKLGCTRAFAFDLTAACTGFVYGITTAWQYIATGQCDTVLVIGAEVLSRVMDYTDRSTCVIFGDGAGAFVLRPTQGEHRLLAACLGSEGNEEVMSIPASGSRCPASHATVDGRQHFVKMKGNSIFRFAVKTMVDVVEQVCEKIGCKVSDIDLLVPHQVNQRILETSSEKLGLPISKFYVNIEKYGNTSAASVPIAFDEAWKAGRLETGDLVVIVAFGGGLTWGAVAVRW